MAGTASAATPAAAPAAPPATPVTASAWAAAQQASAQAGPVGPGGAVLACPVDQRDGTVDLREAVMRALCTDPRTHQSWAQMRAEVAQWMLQRATRWPKVDATLAAGRTVQRDRAPGEAALRTGARTFDTTLDLQWVLWDFGQSDAREQAAQLAVLAANGSHDEAIQAVYLGAVGAYYALVEAQVALTQARESETLTRTLLTDTQRPRPGLAQPDRLAQLQARTALSRQVLALRRADGQLAQARGELALRLGYPATARLDAAPPIEERLDEGFDTSVETMIEQAQRLHPALRTARARLGGARAELDLAQRSDRPAIVATHQQRHQRDVYANTNSGRSVGIQIDIPLFAGFDRKQRVKRAEALVDDARAGLRQAEQQAALDVWTAYQTVREQVASVRMAERFQHSAEEQLVAERQAFKAGDSDMFDVLDAHDSLLEATAARLSALTALAVGRLKLAASLGRLPHAEGGVPGR